MVIGPVSNYRSSQSHSFLGNDSLVMRGVALFLPLVNWRGFIEEKNRIKRDSNLRMPKIQEMVEKFPTKSLRRFSLEIIKVVNY